MRHRYVCGAVLGCLSSLIVGCAEAPSTASPGEREGEAQASLITNHPAPPNAAGQLVEIHNDVLSAEGTGVLISPHYVLTAFHVICGATNDRGTGKDTTFLFLRTGNGNGARNVQKAFSPLLGSGISCEGGPAQREDDIAVLQLVGASPLMPKALPIDNVVYRGTDASQIHSPFIAAGLTGPNGSFGFQQAGYYETDDPDAQTVFFGSPIKVTQAESGDGTKTEKGDSGGPIVGHISNPDRAVIFGVLSGNETDQSSEGDIGVTETVYAPTYDVPNGAQNGTFLRNSMPDKDGDGVPDLDDNCPSTPNPDQADPDGDKIGAACDSCDGSDQDHDQIPFGCDPCPCGTDKDGDNVCDVQTIFTGDCDGWGAAHKTIDNCPLVKNIDQANCNSDAETAHGGSALGDACDPVPCPAFSLSHDGDQKPGISTTIFTEKGGPGGLYTGTITSTTSVRGVGTLSVGARGSAPADDSTGAKTSRTPRSVQVPDTTYRVCLHSYEVATGVKCLAASNMRDTLTADPDSASSVWHPMTLRKPTFPPSIIPESQSEEDVLTYPVGLTRTWLIDTDLTAWKNSSWATGSGVNSGSDLSGFVWMHADTPIGTSDTVTLDTGFHPSFDGQMANHFEGYDATQGTTTFQVKLVPSGPAILPLPDLSTIRIHPCLACETENGVGQWVVNPVLDTQALFMPRAAASSAVGYLQADGTMLATTSNVGTGLARSMATGARVANQVEPFVVSNADAPNALLLTPDGTGVVDLVTVGQDAAVGFGETLPPAPGSGGGRGGGTTHPAIVAKAATVSDAAVAPLAPSARQGFVPVYSRSTGLLFMVGGLAAGGKPNGEILVVQAASSTITSLSVPGYTPETVLAATYNPSDGHLWILDELTQSHSKHVRLVRVDVVQSTAAVVGTWPRLRSFDRHWLTLDRDGGVLLTSSGDLPAAFVSAHLTADGNGHVRVDRLDTGLEALIEEPLVDAGSYGVIVREGLGSFALKRREHLGTLEVSFGDIGGCF